MKIKCLQEMFTFMETDICIFVYIFICSLTLLVICLQGVTTSKIHVRLKLPD